LAVAEVLEAPDSSGSSETLDSSGGSEWSFQVFVETVGNLLATLDLLGKKQTAGNALSRG